MTRRGTAIGAALLAALLTACATVWPEPPPDQRPDAPEAAQPLNPPRTAWGQHSMVVAAHPLAAAAGRRMLDAGGSAVDAAIAVQMVLTLVEPQSSGIGGGLFLVHFDGRDVSAFDGRETAPAAAGPELFMRDGRPIGFMAGVVGGRSVGTPGVLRALELAHRAHGRLPWAALFEPAITLAEQGFEIGPRLALLLSGEGAAGLRHDPAARAYFFAPDRSAKGVGTRLRNPALAALLRRVAAEGADAFHTGSVARDIAAAVRQHPTNPGLLSEADLAGYRAVRRAPLCFDYKAWRLCGMPPPSSGPLAIGQMLGMLERAGLERLPPLPGAAGLEPRAEAVHLLSEAGRLAYADRDRYVADPDFVPLPGGSAQRLLDPQYLGGRGALIGPRSMGRAAPGVPLAPAMSAADDRSAERPSTSHVSVVDAQGHAVSMTSTIENGFGAQIMVHGFLLNNELTDFSFLPFDGGDPVANRVQGGKRPRSAMSPLLVFERASGALVMSLGSPGGSSIINYVVKVLVATLDWGLDLQQAIALPNFGSRNGPTELEEGLASPALVEALRARGHEVRLLPQTSGVQAIQRLERNGRSMWFGASDPRREGLAIGD